MRSKKLSFSMVAVALSVAMLSGCGTHTTGPANTTSPVTTTTSTVVAKYDTGEVTKGELNKQYNLQFVLPQAQSQMPKQEFITYYIVIYKHIFNDASKTHKADHKQAVSMANQAITQLTSVGYKDKQAVLDKMKSLGITQEDLVSYLEKQLVIQGYLKDELKFSNTQLQAYFNQHKSEFVQVSVHHILLKTKAEAENVEKQLKAGANFEKLADKYSTDPSVKQNHGSFANVAPSSFVPEFAKACETQPVGAIGDPVQTQYGFHVIRVDKRSTQSFNEVKSQILQQLQQQKQNSIYDAALKRAHIQTLVKNF